MQVWDVIRCLYSKLHLGSNPWLLFTGGIGQNRGYRVTAATRPAARNDRLVSATLRRASQRGLDWRSPLPPPAMFAPALSRYQLW
jgi:hypothetical protein